MLTTMVATTRVAYSGAVNQQMTFGLQNSEYVIKSIDGLGPVKANLLTTPTPNDAGARFLSAQDEQRNIVITMGYAPSYSTGSTIESLRRALKKVFTPKSKLELTFTDDILGVFKIEGVVESNDPSIFSKEPEVQISIMCQNPYFYNVNDPDTVVIPNPTGFYSEFVIPYAGDVPVGFVFEFTGTPHSGLQPYVYLAKYADSLPGVGLNSAQMRITYQIPPLDAVSHTWQMSSVRGDRRVEYSRLGGGYQNGMPYFSGSLVNMILEPGNNLFTIFGAGSSNSTITYPNVIGEL